LPRLLAARVALLALLAAATLTGCDERPTADGPSGSTPSTTPSLGATAPRPTPAPTRPMDDLERPVAARLSRQLRSDGLHLDYLDCPAWDGELPGRMVCDGYLAGVVADVEVRLHGTHAGAVTFDARLSDGVISTQALVDRLRREGYTEVDCGDVGAYPVVVGTELVCRVRDAGRVRYVVATVTDGNGAVTIADY
jgi:hypothetical protein